MKKLLSLPPNLVDCLHDITGLDGNEFFCTCDPEGTKVGSGGGTAWLMQQAAAHDNCPFAQWLPKEKRILVHAGGQSRRLPAYAPSGKILTPIPVFRWKRGQRLGQNLLDLQLPLYEQIMHKAPESLHTMIVSGDVLIRANEPLQEIPEADVVCYGLWVDASLAQNHGVFISKRSTPTVLDHTLQKPSIQKLGELRQQYFYLMDIGIWLLSDKAMDVLMRKSTNSDGSIRFYDLYTDFGQALGSNPVIADEEINNLSVAILPLPGGEFHHYGTSREMISSTLAIQNSVIDQREIMHLGTKPHPSIFIQNADVQAIISSYNTEVWIENSYVGPNWKLSQQNIITGVMPNDWQIELKQQMCIDIVPIGSDNYAVRPYGFIDPHPGDLLQRCGMENVKSPQTDAKLYPILSDVTSIGHVLQWMLHGNDNEGKLLWTEAEKMSADEISAKANLRRLQEQRNQLRKLSWTKLAENHRKSVFYQLDLADAAKEFKLFGLQEPKPLPADTDRLTLVSDAMFRSLISDPDYEARAFALMREGLTATAMTPTSPRMNVYSDQIVWSRSPVRIDLAGGWTDTPPYSLMEGGNVVNIAIELNGQPPLQVYIKPSTEFSITLRSIDLGAAERITTFEELTHYNMVGSPFSIPKAALSLAGFAPAFSTEKFDSLKQALQAFGCGIEMTMLSAIPAGSGLGTSSILASTVLGAVNEFCALGWDKHDIGNRTLVLEQLLTTGGGWQDQYGGVLPGAKLLQTDSGWIQQPVVRWLPDMLFSSPEYQPLHLLYYTGITRTAKGILAEIVRGMFLNSSRHLNILSEMKSHAMDMYEAITRGDMERTGKLVRKTWQQNQLLDSGTNPEAVRHITSLIDDLCLGYKLPGAGGGGYLYMIAKDMEAARRIREILTQNPTNAKARFVDMTLSHKGLEISKS